MTEDAGFSINGFWLAVSAVNFAILVVLLYGAMRIVRWARAIGHRDREIEELRARVARLEGTTEPEPRKEGPGRP